MFLAESDECVAHARADSTLKAQISFCRGHHSGMISIEWRNEKPVREVRLHGPGEKGPEKEHKTLSMRRHGRD